MDTDFSYATVHCIQRIKERTGLNEKDAHKLIARALKSGRIAEDFSSWERSFLQKKELDGAYAVAYNGFCFIIGSNGFCLTMFPLPAWFSKKKHVDGKTRIKKVKAYAKLHYDTYFDDFTYYDYYDSDITA